MSDSAAGEPLLWRCLRRAAVSSGDSIAALHEPPKTSDRSSRIVTYLCANFCCMSVYLKYNLKPSDFVACANNLFLGCWAAVLMSHACCFLFLKGHNDTLKIMSLHHSRLVLQRANCTRGFCLTGGKRSRVALKAQPRHWLVHIRLRTARNLYLSQDIAVGLSHFPQCKHAVKEPKGGLAVSEPVWLATGNELRISGSLSLQ